MTRVQVLSIIHSATLQETFTNVYNELLWAELINDNDNGIRVFFTEDISLKKTDFQQYHI